MTIRGDQIEIKLSIQDLASEDKPTQKIELVRNVTLAQVLEVNHINSASSQTRCKVVLVSNCTTPDSEGVFLSKRG